MWAKKKERNCCFCCNWVQNEVYVHAVSFASRNSSSKSINTKHWTDFSERERERERVDWAMFTWLAISGCGQNRRLWRLRCWWRHSWAARLSSGCRTLRWKLNTGRFVCWRARKACRRLWRFRTQTGRGCRWRLGRTSGGVQMQSGLRDD